MAHFWLRRRSAANARTQPGAASDPMRGLRAACNGRSGGRWVGSSRGSCSGHCGLCSRAREVRGRCSRGRRQQRLAGMVWLLAALANSLFLRRCVCASQAIAIRWWQPVVVQRQGVKGSRIDRSFSRQRPMHGAARMHTYAQTRTHARTSHHKHLDACRYLRVCTYRKRMRACVAKKRGWGEEKRGGGGGGGRGKQVDRAA